MNFRGPACRSRILSKADFKGAVCTEPADGRRRLVQLTHAEHIGGGHELARELVAVGPEVSRETLAGLSEEEQRDLLRLLDRLGRKG